MLVPISIQLPSSLTRKKKFIAITSQRITLTKNNDIVSILITLQAITWKQQLTKSKGINILNIINAPIVNGENTVKNLVMYVYQVCM